MINLTKLMLMECTEYNFMITFFLVYLATLSQLFRLGSVGSPSSLPKFVRARPPEAKPLKERRLREKAGRGCAPHVWATSETDDRPWLTSSCELLGILLWGSSCVQQEQKDARYNDHDYSSGLKLSALVLGPSISSL
jgi:hypothetical protein